MYRSPSIEYFNLITILNIITQNQLLVRLTRGKLTTFNYSSSNEDYFHWFRINVSKLFCKVRKNLDQGKSLYGMMCSHCHGINGDGKGSVDHPVYSKLIFHLIQIRFKLEELEEI